MVFQHEPSEHTRRKIQQCRTRRRTTQCRTETTKLRKNLDLYENHLFKLKYEEKRRKNC